MPQVSDDRFRAIDFVFFAAAKQGSKKKVMRLLIRTRHCAMNKKTSALLGALRKCGKEVWKNFGRSFFGRENEAHLDCQLHQTQTPLTARCCSSMKSPLAQITQYPGPPLPMRDRALVRSWRRIATDACPVVSWCPPVHSRNLSCFKCTPPCPLAVLPATVVLITFSAAPAILIMTPVVWRCDVQGQPVSKGHDKALGRHYLPRS